MATASNVFAHPERVRPAVRERVEAAARGLGYLGPIRRLASCGPARSTRSGSSPGQLGVQDALRNPVFHQFLLGVAQACDEAGVNLLVSCDLHRPGAASAVVDGFVFRRVEHLRDIEPARLRRLPFVVIDSDPGPDVSSVRVDARAGSAAAAPPPARARPSTLRGDVVPARLRPAEVPPARPPPSPRRCGHGDRPGEAAGYADALAEAGIAIGDVPMVQAHPWERDAARLILDVAPEATAILSMSAMQAIAVMDEAGCAAASCRATLGGRLQRHPRGRPRQPAAYHRRRHEHREGPRRRQAGARGRPGPPRAPPDAAPRARLHRAAAMTVAHLWGDPCRWGQRAGRPALPGRTAPV